MLSVSDAGPSISAKDREHELQRFVRLDSARSQSGSGLGSSLVRAVANPHKAELVLANKRPGLQIAS